MKTLHLHRSHFNFDSQTGRDCFNILLDDLGIPDSDNSDINEVELAVDRAAITERGSVKGWEPLTARKAYYLLYHRLTGDVVDTLYWSKDNNPGRREDWFQVTVSEICRDRVIPDADIRVREIPEAAYSVINKLRQYARDLEMNATLYNANGI